MQYHRRWALLLMACALTSGCSSKADRALAKEMEEAKKRQAYYNSPEFKAKQREIMEQQTRGTSEAMRNFRFPDASATKQTKTKDDQY